MYKLLSLLIAFVIIAINPYAYAKTNCPPPSDDGLSYGRELVLCGDFDTALKVLNTELGKRSDPVERAAVQVYIGQAYLALDNYLDAQVNFERAILAYNTPSYNKEAGEVYYYAGLAKLGRNLPDEGLTYFYEGIRRSTAVEDNANLARLNFEVAQILTSRREYTDAQESFANSVVQYQANNDREGESTALIALGDVAFNDSRPLEAFDYYTQAIAIVETLDATAVEADLLVRLGRLNNDQGNYVTAREQLDGAIVLFVELENTDMQVSALAEKADVLYALGEYDLMLDTLVEARNIARSASCETRLALFSVDARIATVRAKFNDAYRIFGNAFNLECYETQPRLKAEILNGYGLLAVELNFPLADELQFALTDFRELQDRIGERDALLNIGKYYLRERDFTPAVDFLYTALDIANETQSIDSQIEVTLTLAEVDLARRRYDDSLATLQTALGIATEVGNIPAQARSLDGIARLYYTRGQYEEATEFFQDAAELYGDEGNPSYEGRRLYYQALIYEQNGEYDLAETFYVQAIDLLNNIGYSTVAIPVELSLGALYQRLNRYEDALVVYQSALENAAPSFNFVAVADSYRDLIAQVGPNFYTDFTAILNFLSQFLSNQPDAVDQRSLATALNAIADIELILFDQNSAAVATDAERSALYDNVEARYAIAYAVFNRLGDEVGLAETLNRLGLQGMRRTIPSRSGTGGFFQEALNLARLNENAVLESAILNNLGDYFVVSSQFDAAFSNYRESLRLATTFDPVLALQIQIKMGLLYERLGDKASAVRELTVATNELEAIYANLDSESERQTFGGQSLYLLPYERLIRYYGLNIVQGREADAATALNFAERSRARSYLFQLGGQDFQFGTEEDQAALERWRNERDNLVNLTEQLRNITSTNDESIATELRTEIQASRENLAQIEEEFGVSSLRQVIGINVASLDRVQTALPENTAMVVYYVSPETYNGLVQEAGRVFIFVITRNSIQQFPHLINSYQDDLVARITTFRNTPTITEPLTLLYQTLITPVEGAIADYENLVIVPHDVLNYLPFEALIDANNTPLIDRFDVNYAPSATVYTLLQEQILANESTGEPLVMSFGDDLFYAVDEVELVADILSSEPFSDDVATETLFTERASNAEIIHIAAHGVFSVTNPLESYIALSADETNDGTLQVQEIYGLSFNANPLVVLSACETAVSEINAGDELQGMTRAFLLTGARGVIASLWSVDDESTSLLMTEFYTQRTNGMSDSEALAVAKRKLKETYSEPYYWAGFVLVGLDG